MPKSPGSGNAKDDNLVPLLLAYLKQEYVLGEEDVAFAMLKDIAANGKDPRQLGSLWGQLSDAVMKDTLAGFEAWKSQGRVYMPVSYFDHTLRRDVKCFIVRCHPDGSLDLSAETDESTNSWNAHKVQAADVRRRPVENCFAPRRPASAQVQSPVAAQVSPEQVPEVLSAVSTVQLRKVVEFFDSEEYGEDYMTVIVGDSVEVEHEEGGWAYGKLTSSKNYFGCAIKGWYPADYAELSA